MKIFETRDNLINFKNFLLRFLSYWFFFIILESKFFKFKF